MPEAAIEKICPSVPAIRMTAADAASRVRKTVFFIGFSSKAPVEFAD
jgi:hypothetical protein